MARAVRLVTGDDRLSGRQAWRLLWTSGRALSAGALAGAAVGALAGAALGVLAGAGSARSPRRSW